MSDEDLAGTAPSSPVEQTPETPSDVPVETPEAKGEEAEDQAEVKEESPKPRSGFQRQKLKLAAQEARIRELETYLNTQQQKPQEPTKRPKPEDFTDWDKYQSAEADWWKGQMHDVAVDVSMQVRKAEAAQKAQEARQATLKEFQAECEEAAVNEFPDAQEAAKTLLAEMGKWRPEILEVIASARNAPTVHYWLTKNPTEAKYLNSLDPISAAMMVGELQTRADLPQAKKATTAPPPIHSPKGGATPPRDPYQLAKKDDATDYIRMRIAEMKKDQK